MIGVGLRLPAGLAAGAGCLVLALGLALPELAPVFRVILSLSALPAFLSAGWLFRDAGRLAEAEREALRAERALLRDRRKEFEAERTAVRAELERRTRLLERREADLADRLTRFHEWMEFPGGSFDANLSADPDSHEPDPEALRRKDLAALEVVRERTDRIFDRIKHGEYYADGAFRRERMSADIIDLFESVARVYNPESQHPLLETSIEQLFRSLGRASLQMLVVLDGLPLKLKRQNLRGMYEKIQKGVKLYSLYRDWKPFIDKTQSLRWAGRLAISSNPVTAVGWIAVQEGAIYGARKFSSHVMERYALGLLFDLSFIIGGEAAGIFGGDFRRREPDWIYGVELTDLLRRVPLNRTILRDALNEIGRLRLRSEYDRVFLYRCVAAGRSARPEDFDCRGALSLAERQGVAERLEAFLAKHVDAPAQTAEKWAQAAENRLGVRLRVDLDVPAPLEAEQAADALRCLAGFLMDVKRFPADRLAGALAESRCARLLAEAAGPEAMDRRVQTLAAEPPMMFDYPGLDPDGPLLDPFLEDLIDLCVRVFPFGRGEEEVRENTARHFRHKDLKSLVKRMDRAFVNHLAERLGPDSPERRVKPDVARALLGLFPSDEPVLFLYRDVRIDLPAGETADDNDETVSEGDLWLMAAADRLWLARLGDSPESGQTVADVLWEGRPRGVDAVFLTEETGRFGGHGMLSGGRWRRGPEGASLRIPGPTLGGRDKFFRPLRRFVGREPEIVEAE
ncbi:MAG: hypothetical protein ACLFRG_01120 [Desulfococcaceae bacterium]